MSSIWTDLYKRSSFESNALWENPSCRIVPGGWRPLCSLAVPQLSHVLRVERGLRTVKQDGLGEAGLCAFLAVCIFFFLGKYCTRATPSPLNTTDWRAHSRGGKAGGPSSKRDQSTVGNTVLTDCFKDGGKALSLSQDCVQSYVP